METLCKYVDNIIEHPDEEKFRKIRRSNKIYQERVALCEGHNFFLEAVGFDLQLIDDQVTSPYMVISEKLTPPCVSGVLDLFWRSDTRAKRGDAESERGSGGLRANHGGVGPGTKGSEAHGGCPGVFLTPGILCHQRRGDKTRAASQVSGTLGRECEPLQHYPFPGLISSSVRESFAPRP